MNSVAGNKDRVAVTARSRKYGVRAGGGSGERSGCGVSGCGLP